MAKEILLAVLYCLPGVEVPPSTPSARFGMTCVSRRGVLSLSYNLCAPPVWRRHIYSRPSPVYSSIEFRRSAASTGQPRVDESTKKAMKKGLVKKSSPSWGAVSVGSACVDIECQAFSVDGAEPDHWLISTQG